MNKIKLKTQGILFDVDGTLIDSHEANTQFWNDFCNARNLDSKIIIPGSIGCRISDTIQKYAPQFSDPILIHKLETTFPMKYGNKVKPTKGAIQLLEKLSKLPGNKKKFGVVTSASLLITLKWFNQFNLSKPDAFITSEAVSKGKPDPEPYLLGKSQLGLSQSKVVVFEDSPSGIESGKRAGCTVIGISSNYSANDLIKFGSDIVIKDFINVDIDNYDLATNTFDLIIKDYQFSKIIS